MLLKLLPVWAPLAALLGFLLHESLQGWGPAIVPLLMFIMLCMGLSLQPADFYRVGRYRWAVLAGMLLQFSVMPLMALAIARLLDLDRDLTTGMLLVGTVAGGTASNVMAFLARGNVALSVSMTALSTLLSVALTPLLLTLLIGSRIEVPAGAMLESLLKIILLPVGLGIALNTRAHHRVARIAHLLPPASVLAILLIILIVVALNGGRLTALAAPVVAATLLHNLSGLAMGYLAARALGFDSTIRRTIALEVGMQNSGLATALALKFFNAATALPGAIFSVWLNLTGSIFASACVRADAQRVKPEKDSIPPA